MELNRVVRTLLEELTRFQQRALAKNQAKARHTPSRAIALALLTHIRAQAKKRYVCGLREVQRSVERKKAKCVIVTPNIERISSPEGGLFEAVESIVRTSQQHRINVIFAMTRTTLGKAISKRLKIAALAILDPSGTPPLWATVQDRDDSLKLPAADQALKSITKRHSCWPARGEVNTGK